MSTFVLIITDHVVCFVLSLQICKYEKARGSGFRCEDACDFAVKPEKSRDVNGFSCTVNIQKEGDDDEHSFDLHPGFTPVKVEKNTFNNRRSLYVCVTQLLCLEKSRISHLDFQVL